MTKNELPSLLKQRTQIEFATTAGTRTHKQMQGIFIDQNTEVGNIEIIEKIKTYPHLLKFFANNSKTELPVAGFVKNKFVSKRIDRLCIDSEHKQIMILDYKTDTDKGAFFAHYKSQMYEYRHLVQQIYPDYKIQTFILWLQDFELQEII